MRCLRISNSSGGCLVSTCSGKPRRVEAAHRSAQMGRIAMPRRVGLLARGSWLSAAFPGLGPSGLQASSSPLTVARQRRTCTGFPLPARLLTWPKSYPPPTSPREAGEGPRRGVSGGGGHLRQLFDGGVDPGLRELDVLQLAREVRVIRGHVEVAVPGEVEEDRAGVARLASGRRLFGPRPQ